MAAPPLRAAVPRLDSLTGLRFFAALFVLLDHSTRHYAPVPGLLQLFEMGPAGVTFFFVLSGFVLTWSHSAEEGAGRQNRRFFLQQPPHNLGAWLLAR